MFSPLAMLVLISLIKDSTVTSTSTLGMPVLSEMLLIRSDLRMGNVLNVNASLNVKHSFKKKIIF
jgi:hypothetical protein